DDRLSVGGCAPGTEARRRAALFPSPLTSPAARIKGQARQSRLSRREKNGFHRCAPNLPFFARHDPLTRTTVAVGRAAPSPLCPGECQRPFPRSDRGGFAQGGFPCGTSGKKDTENEHLHRDRPF